MKQFSRLIEIIKKDLSKDLFITHDPLVEVKATFFRTLKICWSLVWRGLLILMVLGGLFLGTAKLFEDTLYGNFIRWVNEPLTINGLGIIIIALTALTIFVLCYLFMCLLFKLIIGSQYKDFRLDFTPSVSLGWMKIFKVSGRHLISVGIINLIGGILSTLCLNFLDIFKFLDLAILFFIVIILYPCKILVPIYLIVNRSYGNVRLSLIKVNKLESDKVGYIMKHQKIAGFFLLILLSSCTPRPGLEFDKESLTGQEYCIIHNRLLPVENCNEGELTLKRFKEESPNQKSAIKASLKVALYDKRDYSINPNEILNLWIDGIRYKLDVISSSKRPQEEINQHTAYLSSRRTVTFEIVKEVTRRKISFFLSNDYLSKISGAKSAHFEISLPSLEKTSAFQGYPVILSFNAENTSLIQEFKNKCINNFLNQSE